ncbi:hypothetical protein Q5752_003112 [Cryptotrichosporon argae]
MLVRLVLFTLAAPFLAHALVVPRPPGFLYALTLTPSPVDLTPSLNLPAPTAVPPTAPADAQDIEPPGLPTPGTASLSLEVESPAADTALPTAEHAPYFSTAAEPAIGLAEGLFAVHEAVKVVDAYEVLAACYDNFVDAPQRLADELDETAAALRAITARLRVLASAGHGGSLAPGAVETCFGGKHDDGDSLEARATGGCTNAYYVITIGEAIYHIADDLLLIFSHFVENDAVAALYPHFRPAVVAYKHLLHNLRRCIPYLAREVAVLNHRLDDIGVWSAEL